MALRSAAPKIPPKSSVSPRLPFYKNHPLLSRSESTLTQVLIPLHLNSFRMNTYIKPGGGPLHQPQSFATCHPHNAGGRAHSLPSILVGKEKWKLAPRGELSPAHKRPPCDSTMERQIRSPIPVP